MKKGFYNVKVLVACIAGGMLTNVNISLKVPKGTDLSKLHKTHRNKIFGEVTRQFPDAKHLTPVEVKHGAIMKYFRRGFLHAHIYHANNHPVWK